MATDRIQYCTTFTVTFLSFERCTVLSLLFSEYFAPSRHTGVSLSGAGGSLRLYFAFLIDELKNVRAHNNYFLFLIIILTEVLSV